VETLTSHNILSSSDGISFSSALSCLDLWRSVQWKGMLTYKQGTNIYNYVHVSLKKIIKLWQTTIVTVCYPASLYYLWWITIPCLWYSYMYTTEITWVITISCGVQIPCPSPECLQGNKALREKVNHLLQK
jgi:hypothetical protein